MYYSRPILIFMAGRLPLTTDALGGNRGHEFTHAFDESRSAIIDKMEMNPIGGRKDDLHEI